MTTSSVRVSIFNGSYISGLPEAPLNRYEITDTAAYSLKSILENRASMTETETVEYLLENYAEDINEREANGESFDESKSLLKPYLLKVKAINPDIQISFED